MGSRDKWNIFGKECIYHNHGIEKKENVWKVQMDQNKLGDGRKHGAYKHLRNLKTSFGELAKISHQ